MSNVDVEVLFFYVEVFDVLSQDRLVILFCIELEYLLPACFNPFGGHGDKAEYELFNPIIGF